MDAHAPRRSRTTRDRCASHHSRAYLERAGIYDALRTAGVTGFVSVSGDRHSFWADVAAKALPPHPFDPVGVAFITGSVSAPGLVEALEHAFPKEHPLRALYLADVGGAERPHPAVNMLMHHGVRSCLEYQRSGWRKGERPRLEQRVIEGDPGLSI